MKVAHVRIVFEAELEMTDPDELVKCPSWEMPQGWVVTMADLDEASVDGRLCDIDGDGYLRPTGEEDV